MKYLFRAREYPGALGSAEPDSTAGIEEGKEESCSDAIHRHRFDFLNFIRTSIKLEFVPRRSNDEIGFTGYETAKTRLKLNIANFSL